MDAETKQFLQNYEWPLSTFADGVITEGQIMRVIENSDYYTTDITSAKAQLPTDKDEYQWNNIFESPFFLPILVLITFDKMLDTYKSFSLAKSLAEFDANTAEIRGNLIAAWKDLFDEIGFDISDILTDDELLDILGSIVGENLNGDVSTSGSVNEVEENFEKFVDKFLQKAKKKAAKKFGKGDQVTKLMKRAGTLKTLVFAALKADKAIRITNSLAAQAGYRQQLERQWPSIQYFLDTKAANINAAKQLMLEQFEFLRSHDMTIKGRTIHVARPINEILMRLVSREGLSVDSGDSVVVYKLNRHRSIHRTSVIGGLIYLLILFIWFIVWLIVQIFFFGWAWGYRM